MLAWPVGNESSHPMKVEGPGPIRPANVRRAEKRRERGSGFAAEISAEEQQTAKVASGAPLAAVDAVLTLQEVPDATTPQGRVVKRGRDLLDHLEQLRTGLLTGTIPQGKLRALRQALDEQFESIEDPRLSAVLEEIELRAAVELAKLDRLPRSV